MSPVKTGKGEPPKGFLCLLWRAPIWIYRRGLGGLISGRMLLLCGWQVDGSDDDYFVMGRDHVPFIALKLRTA